MKPFRTHIWLQKTLNYVVLNTTNICLNCVPYFTQQISVVKEQPTPRGAQAEADDVVDRQVHLTASPGIPSGPSACNEHLFPIKTSLE